MEILVQEHSGSGAFQGYHSEPNSIRYALKRHLFRVVLA